MTLWNIYFIAFLNLNTAKFITHVFKILNEYLRLNVVRLSDFMRFQPSLVKKFMVIQI